MTLRRIISLCDVCRVYWCIGTNLLTPYQEMVWRGDWDDEIGGPQHREPEIFRHNAETRRLLDGYEEIREPSPDGEY